MNQHEKWKANGRFAFIFVLVALLLTIVVGPVITIHNAEAKTQEDLQVEAIIKAEERQAKALEGILKELKEIRRAMK